MINVGIDASGGDNGSIPVCKAIASEINKNLNIKYFIFGDTDEINNSFKEVSFDISNDRIVIVDAKEKITMNDHPVFAIRSKKNSSIVKAGNALIDNEIDCFISAGNTGALVALAQFFLKPINGVDRPVVAAIIPTKNGMMLLIDSGCNVDSKPEWLYQYAKLANQYYKLMFNKESPKIGLLSVGVEPNKGNALTLETYKLLENNKNLNFIGNVEARDLVLGICDILITDGFAGNVFLKTYEGTATFILNLLKEEIMSSFVSKIGGLLIKPGLKKILNKYNAKIYGGAPILGTKKLVLKCHGNSTSEEYIYTIRQAYNLICNDIINKLIEGVKNESR